MKGKNRQNRNDDKKARKPVVDENALTTEVLASSESNPTNDFMDSPVEEPKKSVTLNDLAEIDPELLTGKPADTAIVPDLLPCPRARTARSRMNPRKRRSLLRSTSTGTKMHLSRASTEKMPVSSLSFWES